MQYCVQLLLALCNYIENVLTLENGGRVVGVRKHVEWSFKVRNLLKLSKTSMLMIDADDLCHSLQEKTARATLFTAITRHIYKDTILIVDGMNDIKGFRYQLYCKAREAGVRVATRFEEPSSMVRWDAPLFTILWDDPTPPLERISDAVTTGIVKSPNHTTNALVSVLMAAQAAGPIGGPIVITIATLEPSSNTSAIDSSVLRVRLALSHRALTLSELQPLKRQFVAARRKAVTLGSTEKGRVEWGEEGVGRAFAEFLEEGLGVTR
ncbi:chromatin associated protein KTI12 [Suillus bovinus]|uniref:chromatin associated protein KTI12 n=1 Tax=Suillus bovinus TaxID=48563 RepID=UPI001B88593D|nr:chromatin associated protein KTI12 [Suillus bovinus]KAG2130798.1 chromatin associated protein KTI12 [Suillus bovinus]